MSSVSTASADVKPEPQVSADDGKAAAAAILGQSPNERHFVVQSGADVVVAEELEDGSLTLRTFDGFKRLYIKRTVAIPDGDGGFDVQPLADYWLKSRDGRLRRRLVFAPPPQQPDPRDYNLWVDFTVEPKPGNWSRLRNHIRDVVCSGRKEHCNYLLDKLAALVQRPGEVKGASDSSGANEMAVVLGGSEGAGKGILVRETMALVPARHVIHLSSARGLVGQFNSHLSARLIVFGDEALFAGNRQHEGRLKALITEPTIDIEAKGIDVRTESNHCHVFISTNEEWAVPAGLEARRFLVLTVSPARVGDHAYFKGITEQQESGGRAAMLHELLRRDISGRNLRDVPKTSELLEQKLLTMTAPQRWWFERLSNGALVAWHDERWRHDAEVDVLRSSLIEDYKEHGRGRRCRDDADDRSTATELGITLKKLLPHGYPRSVRRGLKAGDVPPGGLVGRSDNRPWFWTFPSLADCRAHFEAEVIRQPIEWPL